MIFLSERLLTDNSLHSSSILGGRIVGVQLVGDGSMIRSVLLDGFLHQPGQRGKHVYWGVDLFVMELSVDEDLALGDVAGQIGDWMGDVVVGHRQDGDLGNGTIFTMDTTSSLINCR